MLRSLHIENFRALREFRMSGLGRVNLLVGTNNCGKTSVLEAVHLLSVPGHVSPLSRSLARRGEVRDGPAGEIDVAHLIHGHRIDEGATFAVRGDRDGVASSLVASFHLLESGLRDFARVVAQAVNEPAPIEDDDHGTGPSFALSLEWRRGNGPQTINLPLTPRGGLLPGVAKSIVGRAADEPVNFITTEGLSRDNVVDLFEDTVLTPDEEVVYRALRTIEPGIGRLASIGSRGRRADGGGRGGLAMMVDGQRIPIGSMGDGIWRLLGIALALVRARGGILLVDEIDTGLHYSVLVDMWRLVFETAKALDVQVFATTHSRDCYEALAAVTDADRHEISIQRIERGKAEAVAFSEGEIQQAAAHGIEVR